MKKGTEDDIEVNIVTKGVIEGLQSALGSIKVAGQVSKTEQLAQKQIDTSKKIEQVMSAVKENTAKSLDRTEIVAERTAAVVTKLGGTLTTDVTGLEMMMGTTVTEIRKLSDTDTMATTEQLLETSNDLSLRQWGELQNVNKNLIAMKTSGALT